MSLRWRSTSLLVNRFEYMCKELWSRRWQILSKHMWPKFVHYCNVEGAGCKPQVDCYELMTKTGLFSHFLQAFHLTHSRIWKKKKQKKKALIPLWCDERIHSVKAPSRVPEMQATSLLVSCPPPESNGDEASASYESQPTAMMFQKQLFPSENKHILGTCCGVHCLFSQCALLALGPWLRWITCFVFFLASHWLSSCCHLLL